MTRHHFRSRAFGTVLVLLAVATAPAVGGNDGTATAAPELDLGTLLAQARPAVVTVIAKDEKGQRLSSGSGFIIGRFGAVLTAWHVVAGAEKAEVTLADGTSHPMRGLLAWDARRDFAVLKISATSLPTIPLGDSDAVSERDRVLVLGESESEGTVSAVRELPGGKMMQVKGWIPQGNSGGPVLNARGEAIGIVSSGLMVWDEELDFAVPVNEIKPKLKLYGKLTPLPRAGGEAVGEADLLYTLGLMVLALREDDDKLAARGRLELAVEVFRDAATKRKNFAEAQLYAGYCLSWLWRRREAIEAYRLATRMKPEFGDAYLAVGRAYDYLAAKKQAAEAFQKAISAYRQAVHSNPNDLAAQLGLAAAYGEAGQFEYAVDAYKRVLEIKPDNASAYLHLGDAYNGVGRPESALEAYRQAVHLQPDSVTARLRLAWSYGQAQEAIEAYREAIRIKPDDGEAYLGLAQYYDSNRQHEESMEVYKEAVSAAPKCARAHYELGRAYLKAGDREAAVEEYKAVRDLDAELGAQLLKELYPP